MSIRNRIWWTQPLVIHKSKWGGNTTDPRFMLSRRGRNLQIRTFKSKENSELSGYIRIYWMGWLWGYENSYVLDNGNEE